MYDVDKLIDGVEGWCTAHKAAKLFELASDPSVSIAVEIGVFAGKSLLPVAAAMKAKGFGHIYGVEPWDTEVVLEFSQDKHNDKWWGREDLLKVKKEFLQKIVDEQLVAHTRIIELPSDSAVQIFQGARFARKINMLHIDGSHALEQSVFDAAYWLRLCASGAFIVLDDINWASVSLAFDFLTKAAHKIYSISDETMGHFAIFQKA